MAEFSLIGACGIEIAEAFADLYCGLTEFGEGGGFGEAQGGITTKKQAAEDAKPCTKKQKVLNLGGLVCFVGQYESTNTQEKQGDSTQEGGRAVKTSFFGCHLIRGVG